MSITEPAFLSVDQCFRSLPVVAALRSALSLGMLDRLAEAPSSTAALVQGHDEAGVRLLIDVLRGAGLLTGEAERVQLDGPLRTAMDFRDLLEAKLDYAPIAAEQCFSRFASIPRDMWSGFEGPSGAFFEYPGGTRHSAEVIARTRRWMRYVSALTRYKAPLCAARFDFAVHRRWMDVGGNSGEFVLQILKGQPSLQATVVDLPIVCGIGREHVAGALESERIAFQPVDFRSQPLPPGHDLISFKSVLHDWPEDGARMLLGAAKEALPPGGRVLIFERRRTDLTVELLGDGDLVLAPWLPCLRAESEYRGWLEAHGFVDIRCVEVPRPQFFVISAQRPA